MGRLGVNMKNSVVDHLPRMLSNTQDCKNVKKKRKRKEGKEENNKSKNQFSFKEQQQPGC